MHVRTTKFLLFTVVLLSACDVRPRSSTGADNPITQVVVYPDSLTLDPQQSFQFRAYGRTQAGDSVPVSVDWAASLGSVSAFGLYTADTSVTDALVSATLASSSVSASSKVKKRRIVRLVIVPKSVTLPVGGSQQFAAYGVTNTGDSVGVAVTYSATGGTVSSAGAYTAGQTPGVYRVIAKQSNGTHADTAVVTVSAVAPPPPGTVGDLAVAGVTTNSVTLSFVEVSNGAGQPANYDVRFVAGAISWGAAASVTQGTCATPVAGSAIGAARTCTVLGLQPGTSYQFQLVAFRGTLNLNAVFGGLSNVASGTTAAIVPPPPPLGSGTVLLQDDFEASGFGTRGWYDFRIEPTLTDTTHVVGSTRALEVHFSAGANTPPWVVARRLFTPSPTIYISYWVRYSANWVGSGLPYHPHEFQVMSDLDGDFDGLSNSWMEAYVEENYQNGGIPRLSIQDSKAINTSYGTPPIDLTRVTENRSVGGCNGLLESNVTVSCFSFPPWYNDKEFNASQVWFQPQPGPGYKGNWNHVEAYFQINSIVNGIGQADGVAQYWFNGTLVIDRHDVLFRTGARPNINFKQFVMAPYIGDGSPVDQTMWIDNLVVATGRP